MTIDWAPRKDEIIALHNEGKKLTDIRKHMLDKHQFNPSLATFTTSSDLGHD